MSESVKPIVNPLVWMGSSRKDLSKSKSGIATPKADLELIFKRLKDAHQLYAQMLAEERASTTKGTFQKGKQS
ncbi:MAG: hypothetical protein K1X64_18215 [Myxococcaceae bacterium]|nr:hypothetical protein [Myxococcaceae bacterium]